MWLFLIVLIVLGFVHTSINLSLVDKKHYAVAVCVVLGVVSFVLYKFAVKLNVLHLERIIHSFDTLSTICIYQIVESIVFMLLSLVLIRSHYSGKNVSYVKYLALVPSGIFLSGTFWGQIYFLNQIDGWAFYQIAFVFAVVIFSVLWITSFFVGKNFFKWAWRMEFKIIISFLQILISMFLPLIAMGIKVNNTNMAVSAKVTACTLAVMMLVAFVGYVLKMFFCRRVS